MFSRAPPERRPARRSRSRERRPTRRSPERRPLPNRPKEKPVGRVHPSMPQASQNKPESTRAKAGEEPAAENEDCNEEKYLKQDTFVKCTERFLFLNFSKDSNLARETLKYSYVSSTPSELYYKYIKGVFQPTQRQLDLCKEFEKKLIQRGIDARAAKPAYAPLQRKQKLHVHKCKFVTIK